jgi:hypothetical protein
VGGLEARSHEAGVSKRRSRCGRLRGARGGLSSIGRASECGSEGYGFETRRPPQLPLSTGSVPAHARGPGSPRGGSSRGRRAPPDRVRPPVRSHRRGDDVCAEGLNRDNEAEGRALGALQARWKTFHVPGRDPRSSSIRVIRRVRPALSGPAGRARAEASGRRLLRWLHPIRGCRARPRRHADGHVRAGLR